VRVKMNDEKRTIHLFAGAGGGLIADMILGHSPIAAVEWEPYAAQVLRERRDEGWFPSDMHVYEGDIRMWCPPEYSGGIFCIHAGFPCQDISVAGKQAGIGDGTRSNLYREVLRIARVVRPKYIFLENVAAIASKSKGYIETICQDLSEIGYESQWTTLSAAACGAPHGRDRWWLRATATEHIGNPQREQNNTQWGTSDLGRNAVGWDRQAARSENRTASTDGTDRPSCEVPDTNDERCQKLDPTYQPDEQRRDGWLPDEKRDTARRQAEPDFRGMAHGLAADMVPDQGFQGWWETEPDIGRTTTDSRNRAAMLKCLGNGQVPICAAVAWVLLGGE
jgi:DNA (cytosine-5)-methyltransferase 1